MPLTFGDCLAAAARQPELVREFDRLAGTHLSTLDSRRPIDAMIDEASGRDREAVLKFAAFVFDAVYLPLLQQQPNEDDDK